MTLDYGGRACAGEGDRRGLQLQAASTFWYLKKHCTFGKIYGACFVADTDVRFRSETRDRLVRECQFAASSHTGVDSITTANAFTEYDSAWRCGRTHVHIVDHLCNARFLQLRSIVTGASQEKTREQSAREDFRCSRWIGRASFHRALEFQGQRYTTADVGDAVIEDTLI